MSKSKYVIAAVMLLMLSGVAFGVNNYWVGEESGDTWNVADGDTVDEKCSDLEERANSGDIDEDLYTDNCGLIPEEDIDRNLLLNMINVKSDTDVSDDFTSGLLNAINCFQDADEEPVAINECSSDYHEIITVSALTASEESDYIDIEQPNSPLQKVITTSGSWNSDQDEDDDGNPDVENVDGELVFDGEDNVNAWAEWTDSINEGAKTVEIDFTLDSGSHVRFELCGESCADDSDGEIKEMLVIGEDNYENKYNVGLGSYLDRNSDGWLTGGLHQPNTYTFTAEDTETGIDYSFEAKGDDDEIWNNDDNELTYSTENYRDGLEDRSNPVSFESISIDTEHGLNDAKEGVKLTVHEVRIKDQDEGSFSAQKGGDYIAYTGEDSNEEEEESEVSCSEFSPRNCPSRCDSNYVRCY